MSTKGASKQRRDLINMEITQLRDLLPLQESARQRLSQLQIMSLTCCFIRKSNYFSKLFSNITGSTENPFEFFQAMSGFLLITTKEGKLLYISENVTEFLGHSMVDMMTQGDSLYDIIDKRDHSTVQSQLLQGNYGTESCPTEEQTFFCRMNVSRSLRRQGGFGDHKVMHVRGHLIQPSLRDHYGNQPVFMACVTPLITPDVKETIIQNNTMIFQSVHSLDMKFMELAKNGEHHLGYSEEEIVNTSWYNYVHPEDLYEAKEKHSQLIKASHEMGCMLTIRVMKQDYSWMWINMVMHIRQPFVSDNSDPAIVCINHVIDPSEANHFKLQSQLYSSHIARSPEFLSNPSSSSPPHTITQVPMDTDQYQMQGYGVQTAGSAGYYHAEFGITTAPIMQPTSGQVSTVGEPVPLTRISMGSLSDSNSCESGSTAVLTPTDTKAITRMELINRLKRKLPQQQQCKPAKQPKIVTSESNHESSPENEHVSFYASAVMAPSYLVDSFVDGDQQILLQVVNDRPVYAQLKKSAVDLTVKDPSLYMSKVMPTSSVSANAPVSPACPLTPDSVLSDGVVSSDFSNSGNTMLTIDVNSEVECIPPSLLTPDVSPMNSPQHKAAPVEAEQCVPSLIAELENAIKKEEVAEKQKFHYNLNKSSKLNTSANVKMAPLLPELDPITIDSFFGTLDDMTKALQSSTADEDEFWSQPQPSPVSVCSHQSAASPYGSQPSASPYGSQPSASPYGTQPAASPYGTQSVASPYGNMSTASPCENQAATSPYENQSAQSPQLPPTYADQNQSDDMFELGEQQLANIVASVAGSIMDMVQRASTAQGGLTADFMLVPNGGVEDQSGFAEVPEVKQEVEDEEEMMSPLHGELINELHQLNQLAANSASSYGDNTDLVDALFKQTL